MAIWLLLLQLISLLLHQWYIYSKYVSCSTLTPGDKNFVLNLSTITEPKNYAEAVNFDCQNKAIESEIQALVQTSTCEFVDFLAGKQLVGSKWVYKIKHKADGSIKRYKGKLMAKRFTQTEGIDFLVTFSPVSKLQIPFKYSRSNVSFQ